MAEQVALCVLCAVLAQVGDGDETPDAPVQPAPALRTSPRLQETLPPQVRQQLPVFVRGDRVTGQPDIRATIEGDTITGKIKAGFLGSSTMTGHRVA